MIEIIVANNERHPWTSGELGFPTVPMPLMYNSGHRQVGDYYSEKDGEIIPLLIERKSLEDAYGSFVQDRNRKRLYNEIGRYHDDERFCYFCIIVEATEKQFMQFYPWAVLKWHQKKGDARQFCARTQKKKATVLQHLRDRGAEVVFGGSREGAIKVFLDAIHSFGKHRL